MTEGLFLRLIQADPSLKGVGAVILDEFHERNLASDVSLALARRLQESSRPDLRLIVMSATLDTKLISEYLGCPILEAHGRTYPIEITYTARQTTAARAGTWRHGAGNRTPVWETAADALADVIAATPDGDVLIFMPGAYEIRRTIEQCRRSAFPESVSFFPLYSELPASEQDAALGVCDGRKVIVSTNVAETSITIEGVRHVIDSGLARINRFDPLRGINELMVEPISQASADQRAGRAGRTAPGTCRRLWPDNEHRHRPAHATPEVRRLDLAEVVLHLLSMGIDRPESFEWLEAPDPTALKQAVATLEMLSAIRVDRDRLTLTKLGGAMSRLPMHPRLSRMLVEATHRHCLPRAALWAALISRARHPDARVGREGRQRSAQDVSAVGPGCAGDGIRTGGAGGLRHGALRSPGDSRQCLPRDRPDAPVVPRCRRPVARFRFERQHERPHQVPVGRISRSPGDAAQRVEPCLRCRRESPGAARRCIGGAACRAGPAHRDQRDRSGRAQREDRAVGGQRDRSGMAARDPSRARAGGAANGLQWRGSRRGAGRARDVRRPGALRIAGGGAGSGKSGRSAGRAGDQRHART